MRFKEQRFFLPPRLFKVFYDGDPELLTTNVDSGVVEFCGERLVFNRFGYAYFRFSRVFSVLVLT